MKLGLQLLVALQILQVAVASSMVTLNGDLAKTIENEINIRRCQHQSGKLVWSDTLASKVAMQSKVAQMCSSGATMPTPQYGENYGAFSGNFPSSAKNRYSALSGMIDKWFAESSSYIFYDRSLNSASTRMFQQMIWNATDEVGCAVCNGMSSWSMACWFTEPYSAMTSKQQANIFDEITCNIIWVPATNAPNTTVPDTLSPPTAEPTAEPTSEPTAGPTTTPSNETDTPLTDAPNTTVPDTLVPNTTSPETLSPDTATPTKMVKNDTLVPDTLSPTNAPVAYKGYWKSVGFYFRATWPRDDVDTWVAKLVKTLQLSWSVQPRGVHAVYICPLVDGNKPVGDEAERRCMVMKSTSRTAVLLGETMQEWKSLENNPDVGVYSEIVVEDEENIVDSKVNDMTQALGASMKQEAPLYNMDHLRPGSEFLNIQAMGFDNGAPAVVVQGGTPSGRWSAKQSQDWAPPEGDKSSVVWWLWLILGFCVFFTFAAMTSFLVIKRQRATGTLSAVTVSEFYRTMPEGFLPGPIPEEHYCYNDDLTSRSSVELDSARSFNMNLGIQPIGRI